METVVIDIVPGAYQPLSYHFLQVRAFPDEGAKFRTATSPMFFKDADAYPTTVAKATMRGLDTEYLPFAIDTVTEHYETIFANGGWVDSFLVRSTFRGYWWRSQHLFIIAASADSVKSFLRSCRKESGGAVDLEPFRVDIDKLHAATPNATFLSMEQDTDVGLATRIDRMTLKGRNLGNTPQAQTFRAQGAKASALRFDFINDEFPGVNLSVTREGAVRLQTHLGPWAKPLVTKEVRLVSACWQELVAPHATTQTSTSSPKGGNDSSGPRPIKGQQPLDGLFEGDTA